jgi:hypothetical protein
VLANRSSLGAVLAAAVAWPAKTAISRWYRNLLVVRVSTLQETAKR